MRKILFRGKRIDSGEWVYGVAFPHDNCGKVTMFRQNQGDGALEGLEVLHETVGQYTGLTDKNGKKIFEGDILAAPDYPNLKYKVSFLNANFCVKCPAQPYLFYLGSRCFDMFGNPEYEIVGNIHDNPELLEVTKWA